MGDFVAPHLGGGPQPPNTRHRWSKEEERMLMNIINHADKGVLKKVIVESDTNGKMTRHDAWDRVT